MQIAHLQPIAGVNRLMVLSNAGWVALALAADTNNTPERFRVGMTCRYPNTTVISNQHCAVASDGLVRY